MSNMGAQVTEESHVTTVTAAMSPYAPSGWDRLLMLDCTSGAITVNLPPAAESMPKRFDFKKIDATANTATIMPDGSDTIDGAISRLLTIQWQTFGALAISIGWAVNYSPMLLAADGEVSAIKGVAANDSRLTALPVGYITGMKLTWISVTQVSISTGSARDSANSLNVVLTSADTADVSVAGDRDFAPGVNQWIFVHAIADSAGVNAPRAFLSLSSTAPTLPAGYDKFRRVGVVRAIVASTFLKVSQTGAGRDRRYQYDEERAVVQALAMGGSIVYAPVSLATLVPPTARRCEMIFGFNSQTASNVMSIRPTGSTVLVPAETINIGLAAPEAINGYMAMDTDTAQSIDYKVTGAASTLDIYVMAYVD